MSRSYRFLPGFDIAHAHHRAAVRDDSKQRPIKYGHHLLAPPDVHQAEQDLATKRLLASHVGSLGVGTQIASPERAASVIDGWRSLRTEVWKWLDGHMAAVQIPKYRQVFVTETQAQAHVAEAARDGACIPLAFAEVVPKVLFRREFADPNAEIAQWARSSVGFTIEWAGLDDLVDPKLAWALASPKPRAPEHIFEDLHFNPKYFAANDSLRRIGIDPAQANNLRDDKNRHPHIRKDPRVPLFPCPAQEMIPRLHQMVVDQAEAAGLFGQTYLEERAQHGYSEAWTQLEAIRLPQSALGVEIRV